MTMNSHVRKLLAQRRKDAEVLRTYRQVAMAKAIGAFCDDLETALRADARDQVRGPEYLIKEASDRCGVSVATLSRMVKDGDLENVNPGGAMKVRGHDLPCRPGRIPYVLGWDEDLRNSENPQRTGVGKDLSLHPDADVPAEQDRPFSEEEYQQFRLGRRSA